MQGLYYDIEMIRQLKCPILLAQNYNKYKDDPYNCKGAACPILRKATGEEGDFEGFYCGVGGKP